jgi:acyl dehydratase
MPTRTLDGPPRVLPLYARAAAPLIPGASRLPFVPGGGGEVPELDLSLEKVTAEPDAVAAYARVCGFTLRDHLPPTYPHVLAFPLQMAVMADGGFPFGAVGLVHVENRIEQRRPIRLGEELTIRVRPTNLRPHPKGRTFSLLTEVRSGREKVWESESTMLRRGKGSDESGSDDGAFAVSSPMGEKQRTRSGKDGKQLPASAQWHLPGDLGRRYASVSGDRNPIHIHALTAKPLGFPGAIAHGMWTKARCLAALQSSLPDAFAATVRFRKPIVLPARVEFACAGEGAESEFEVRDARRGTPHLGGRVEPVAAPTRAKPKPKAKPKSKGKKAT